MTKTVIEDKNIIDSRQWTIEHIEQIYFLKRLKRFDSLISSVTFSLKAFLLDSIPMKYKIGETVLGIRKYARKKRFEPRIEIKLYRYFSYYHIPGIRTIKQATASTSQIKMLNLVDTKFFCFLVFRAQLVIPLMVES